MNRRDSALHASCTGGVVDLTALDDPHSRRHVELYYHPRTIRVLHGEHRGCYVSEAVHEVLHDLMRHFHHVEVLNFTARPWQRLWQPTPAKLIIASRPRRTRA
ncbi:hypothetical protein [Deinococcus soli (ex Cha et al. 2016)]|uniref:Uncharacterized protein n=1 Tax=Deinococcus soli (ex Cha et al. 2016) TaxID=1309411 RepID=A0ACC6KLS4_9DEIO|nr:hypothetical protein [Deinococcus soli (ex Cha et al. 2016)]MDR6753448.1 hypothetical protein [Deinococcus soli (ex Cha et al. 2016)]